MARLPCLRRIGPIVSTQLLPHRRLGGFPLLAGRAYSPPGGDLGATVCATVVFLTITSNLRSTGSRISTSGACWWWWASRRRGLDTGTRDIGEGSVESYTNCYYLALVFTGGPRCGGFNLLAGHAQAPGHIGQPNFEP